MDMDAVDRVGSVDILRRLGGTDVLLVGVGAMASVALAASDLLAAEGVGVTVADPRWLKPVSPDLVALAAAHSLVVHVEDNGIQGGTGAALLQELAARGVRTPVRLHGIPQEFLDHAKRAVILDRIGLTPQAIARDTLAAFSAL
jgi:1-deoxy-D-xylulose-5-phosphate synthase